MSSPIFDAMCDGLEQSSSLTRLQARGVVRLSLKEAGLEADGLTRRQALAVIEKLLPERLVRQGLDAEAANTLTRMLTSRIEAAESDAGDHGPDAMLSRLDRAMGR